MKKTADVDRNILMPGRRAPNDTLSLSEFCRGFFRFGKPLSAKDIAELQAGWKKKAGKVG